jgi:DsbC/DsbD-like thiol-disulfide interchange protein
MIVFLAASLIWTPVRGVRAQSPTENHAKVELIAEQDSIRPGHPLWIGLFFHLDPGWHVYWQNPGDSGEPPKIQWELPPGFQAGAIEWPNPVRLGSGSVVDYGYEDDVLLMVRIKTPAASASAVNWMLGAEVKYIVCREICIPGKVHLSLSFPNGNGKPSEDSEHRGIFEQARRQLPKRAPSDWKVSAISEGQHFVFSVRCNTREQKASFLPLDPGEVENSAPQSLVALNDGFDLTLQKSNLLVKPVKTLRGLVVLGDGSTFTVAAPVLER